MPTSKQILLVDDDPAYANLVEKALSTCQPSCSLKTFSSGAQLFDWLATNRPPLVILLAIQMPGSNGVELLTFLRTLEPYKLIPVVVLSASPGVEEVQKSYASGANSYMIKSMKVDELKRQLKSFIHYWLDIVRTPGCSWFRLNRYSTYN